MRRSPRLLGPLLFIIYVNDIVNVSPVLSYILFADDATLLYSHRNLDYITSVFNNELPKLIKWFQSNKLSLNVSKTNYVVFRTPHRPTLDQNCNIMIDNVCLERKDYVEFLGVIVDQNLNWNKQIENVSLQVSRTIGLLHKVKHYLPKQALVL